MRSIFCISFMVAPICGVTHAAEPDMPALATQLASCTAVYTWGASVADLKKEKALKRRLLGLGNDALEASKFVALSFSHDKAEAFIDHAVQMELIRLESSAKDNDSAYYVDKLNECLLYEEAQAQLLDAIKKGMR